jgi:hypothetical protein
MREFIGPENPGGNEMKKLALLSVFAMLFAMTATFAYADCPSEPSEFGCAFYGGDLDLNDPNQDGLSNENDAIVGGSPYGAATYQNFNWGGGVLGGLATNNLSRLNPATAYWEIRSGVSEGNGGTLIASGTGGTFNQPTGRNEYTNFVGGLRIGLGAGTYWMAVVPNDPGNANRSFNSNTDGLNSMGNQTSGQQFFNSPFFGSNFMNANSQGVFNTFSQAAYYAEPEPSSIVLLGSGLVAVAGVVRRRLSR